MPWARRFDRKAMENRDTRTGVSAYGLRRMERQRKTNSGILLPVPIACL